jgi:hypothetical protein
MTTPSPPYSATSQDFDLQIEAAQAWALAACQGGWLAEEALEPLDALQRRNPASLFEAGTHRPLAAAFFGGTGAGKSSLLNRLAGQAIARAGVERPTSHEVSLFLHESLHLRQLPLDFPVDRARVAQHGDERRRQVLWIDMPDIDSVEANNRNLALAWLPHIDVLIYVVSPERYRDDKGWRLLQTLGGQHAWLFVMNHWDHGCAEQLHDFTQLLHQAGFADPLLFSTDCQEALERRKPDDFAALEASIQALADRHLIGQLQAHALNKRREDLQAALAACRDALGKAEAWERLRARWTQIWREQRASLSKGLEWPLREVAGAFSGRDASFFGKAVKLKEAQADSVPSAQPNPSLLWDDWAQMQWGDALDQLIMAADEAGLPTAPLKARLEEPARMGGGALLVEAQRGLRLALANPGNAAQRFMLKLTGLLMFLLPLAAIGWAAWWAVAAYYQGTVLGGGFLGADFAIHSLLLVGLAWLAPFFLHRLLKPSAARAAEKGLRAGVAAGLELMGEKVEAALACNQQAAAELRQEAENLLAQCTAAPSGPHDAMLDRMIPKP